MSGPDESKPVLVLGGTGHYGWHIVRALVAKQVPVRVLSRSRASAHKALGTEPEIVEGDVTELATPGGAVQVPVACTADPAQELIVIHAAEDDFRAFPNRCTHKNRQLDFLSAEEELECCSGKSRFALSGELLEGPATEPLVLLPVHRSGDELRISCTATAA